jgi:hypothetical protein
MSQSTASEALMAKADRACASARALLDLSDVDGACNRAYYAMFEGGPSRPPRLGCSGGSPYRQDP